MRQMMAQSTYRRLSAGMAPAIIATIKRTEYANSGRLIPLTTGLLKSAAAWFSNLKGPIWTSCRGIWRC